MIRYHIVRCKGGFRVIDGYRGHGSRIVFSEVYSEADALALCQWLEYRA